MIRQHLALGPALGERGRLGTAREHDLAGTLDVEPQTRRDARDEAEAGTRQQHAARADDEREPRRDADLGPEARWREDDLGLGEHEPDRVAGGDDAAVEADRTGAGAGEGRLVTDAAPAVRVDGERHVDDGGPDPRGDGRPDDDEHHLKGYSGVADRRQDRHQPPSISHSQTTIVPSRPTATSWGLVNTHGAWAGAT